MTIYVWSIRWIVAMHIWVAAFPHDIMSCEGDREFVFDLNNTPPNSFEASNGNSGSSVADLADLAKQE